MGTFSYPENLKVRSKPKSAIRTTADRLARHKQEIIAIWDDTVRREVPSAHHATWSGLINSLPDLLDEMGATLRHDPKASKERLAAIFEKHGAQRARFHGFTVSELVKEYQLLRNIILNVLDHDGVIPSSDRNFIISTLDQGIALAIEGFMIRKREEASIFDAVANALEDHVFALNLQLRYIYVSPSAARDLGFNQEDILGKTGWELGQSQFMDQLHPHLTQALEEKRPLVVYTLLPDGKDFLHLEVSVAPILDDQKRVSGVACVSRDVSDRVRAEEEKLELIEECRRQFDAFEREEHGESEGQPVGDSKPQEADEKLVSAGAADKSVAELGRLRSLERRVRNYRDAARIRVGQLPEHEPEEFDLSLEVTDSVERLRAAYPGRFEVVTKKVEGKFDPQGIRRLIDELGHQALELGYQRTPIRFELTSTPAEAVLSVNYGGRRKAEAWDSGVTVLQALVRAMGGRLDVRATEWGGTTTTVHIPRRPHRGTESGDWENRFSSPERIHHDQPLKRGPNERES